MIPQTPAPGDSSQNVDFNSQATTRTHLNRQGVRMTPEQQKQHLEQIALQGKTDGVAQSKIGKKEVPQAQQSSVKATPLTSEERQKAISLMQKARNTIRKEKAEPKPHFNLKRETEIARNTSNGHVQNALKQADAEKAAGRYHYKPSRNDRFERLGDFVVIDGKKTFVAPKANISLDNIEKLAARLIAANDREGLRKLCNTLFTGSYRSKDFSSRRTKIPEILALVALINDKDSKLDGAEKLIREGAKQWRENYIPPLAKNIESGLRKLRMEYPELKDLSDEKLAMYGGMSSNPIDPEAWVEISHGGGYDNIQDFMRGRSDGYPLETFGSGIQVSVQKSAGEAKEFDLGYTKRAYDFFDNPGVFTGRIQAKYLQRAGSAGGEAGLTPENVQYISNPQVTQVAFSPSVSDLPSPKQILELKEKYGEALAKHIEESTSKFRIV